MTSVPYRTREPVIFSNCDAIPAGHVFDSVDPEVVPGYDGSRIREQARAVKEPKKSGRVETEPFAVVYWQGQHRTIPLTLLERVE